MSPTPIDQLARRAGEAVRDGADHLEARRPHVDALRRRDRTRRALTAGTAITVVVLVALVALGPPRPGYMPVIGDGISPHPSEPRATEEPGDNGTPEPITDRIRVAEGDFEGSDQLWVMHAWLTEQDVVCIQLDGLVCVATATEAEPLAAVGLSTTRAAGNEGCVYGAIDKQVATVEVDFRDEETVTLESLDGQQLPNDFYAYCWDGNRQPTSVRARDEQGRVLGSTDIGPAANNTVGPVPTTGPSPTT